MTTATWVGSKGDALELFQTSYCLLIGVAILIQLPAHSVWVRWKGEARATPPILGWLAPGRLSPPGFVALGLLLIAGCALAAARIASLWLPVGLAIGTLWYFAQVIDVPAVRRKPNTVPIILILLAAAHWAIPEDAEQVAGICLLVIKMVVAQMYLSSGLVKWRSSGTTWVTGETLRITLLRYFLRNGSRSAFWLVQHPSTCRFVSAVVLVFELTFWLAIPFPALAWIFVPLGIVFHLGTAVTMRIHYWIYVMPAYLVFVLS